jgi:Tfp pilus assembly protein PilF
MPNTPNPPAEALLQRAAASLRAGQHTQAEAHLHKTLLHDPTNITALHHLALLAHNRGNVTQAKVLLEKALKAAPDNLDLLTTYGTMLHETGQPKEALDAFLRILAIDSARAQIWNAAGICMAETNQPARAIEFYLRAMSLDATLAESYSNLGAVLFQESDADGAIDQYRQALTLKPDFADCHSNLGVALRSRFQYAAAIEAFRIADRLNPNNADILCSLGEALSLIYNEAALDTLQRSVDLRPNDPEKHWNLAAELLKRGDYLAGFREHEWRWQRTRNQAPLRPFTQPYWQGEATLAGATILLHAEQGFGDTLQFLRYLPQVLARGARIVLDVPRALLRPTTEYAHQLSPDIAVLATGDPLPPFDWHIPLMSLAAAFATTLETIPPPQRFTPKPTPHTLSSRPEFAPFANAAERPAVSSEAGSNDSGSSQRSPRPLRIGLAWLGNASHARDRERSIPPKALMPLFELAHCEWVSLQADGAAAQLQQSGINIAQPPLYDFLDTANVIDTLDLVLAVDTAVAHLAASQGVPTWILLPYVADWRWLRPTSTITGTTNRSTQRRAASRALETRYRRGCRSPASSYNTVRVTIIL